MLLKTPPLVNGCFHSSGLRLAIGLRGDYNVITMAIRTRIIRIGNSRGIRVPKALLDEAQLTEEVVLRAERGRLVVKSSPRPKQAARARQGWAEAAQQMHDSGEDQMLDEMTPTRFDEEWEW
jgi:antitoxin MazE